MDDDRPAACITCQVRAARPGSRYCSAVCRILRALRLIST